MRAAVSAAGAGERAHTEGQPGAGLRAGGVRDREAGARRRLAHSGAEARPARGQVCIL